MLGLQLNRELIRKLAEEIQENVNKIRGYSSRPFYELEEKDRLAIRYLIITVAEALTNLGIVSAVVFGSFVSSSVFRSTPT